MTPDLAYQAELTTPTRAKAKLEIAVAPAATTPAYALAPTLNQLAGYRPNITADRTDLFSDAAGNPQQAVNVQNRPGPQGFQTIASPKNATVQSFITVGLGKGAAGHDVLARYTDANGMSFQGQAKLIYVGEQGEDSQGMTIYAFTLEWSRVGDPTFPTA